MEERFSITLPEGTPEAIGEIEQLLNGIEAVEEVTAVSSRSGLDPATINLWIQVAAGVLGAVGTAVPIIQKIKEIFRKKKVYGAKIKLPGGAEISIDETSAEEIVKLLQATQK